MERADAVCAGPRQRGATLHIFDSCAIKRQDSAAPLQPPPPISGCIEQLQLSNQAGPVPGARIWSGKHSRYTRDYADGSLAIDCAAIACMVRSGEPFFIGRPSLGAETRAAHLAAVMRMRARPNVVSRLIRDLASPPGVIIANGSRQQ